MRKAALLCTILLGFGLAGCHGPGTPPIAPAANEGWESSGGDGVACYASEAEAIEGKRENIVTLVTLDFWDAQVNFSFNSPHTHYLDYLSEVENFLIRHSPIFYSRYRMISGKMDRLKWTDHRDLPNIEDSHPHRPLPSHCRLIQLAIRRARGGVGKVPEFSVEYDRDLVENKLDALNQAMLELHENLFLMGKQTPVPQSSSDDIRRLVAYFFAEETHAELRQIPIPSMRSKKVQAELGRYYGDYYRFFMNEALAPVGTGTLEKFNQRTRYLSFGQLLEKIRSRKDACIKKLQANPELTGFDLRREMRHCDHEATYGHDLGNLLSPEEAFVYLGRWVADGFGALLNSENLVAWDPYDDSPDLYLQNSELRRLCHFARTVHPMHGEMDIFTKADHYCFAIRQSPLSFGSLRCKSSAFNEREINISHQGNGLYTFSAVEEVPGQPPRRYVRESLYCQRRESEPYEIGCYGNEFSFRLLALAETIPELDMPRELLVASWTNGLQQWTFVPSERTSNPGSYCEVRD